MRSTIQASLRDKSTAAVVVLAALALCGCKDKGANAEGGAPSASVSVVASASAAPTALPICPDPSMTGKGTSLAACKSSDGKFRAMIGKWTGNYKGGKAEFALTNKLPVDVDSADASIYYYDKAGKQLPGKNKQGRSFPHSSISGGILPSGGIPKGETKNVELGWYEEKTAAKPTCDCTAIPAGTATIEVEIDRVWWKDPRGEDGFVYWENRALAPDNRPMGGVK